MSFLLSEAVIGIMLKRQIRTEKAVPVTILKTIFRITVVAAVIAGLYLGFLVYGGTGDADLSEMTVSGVISSPSCRLTFQFKNCPQNINPADVRLVFSSKALQYEHSFDWVYIAEHATTGRGPYRYSARFDRYEPPPLNKLFDVSFPLSVRPTLEAGVLDALELKAVLYWGGRKQDRAVTTLRHLYKTQSGI